MTFFADAKNNFLEKFKSVRKLGTTLIKVLEDLKKGFVSWSELHVLKNDDQTSYY